MILNQKHNVFLNFTKLRLYNDGLVHVSLSRCKSHVLGMVTYLVDALIIN